MSTERPQRDHIAEEDADIASEPVAGPPGPPRKHRVSQKYRTRARVRPGTRLGFTHKSTEASEAHGGPGGTKPRENDDKPHGTQAA